MRRFGLIFLWFAGRLLAIEPLTPDETARGPSPARVEALVAESELSGWGSLAPALRQAAMQAYERGSSYASAWYYLYRWADLLAKPRSKALDEWIKAIESAGVAHGNMARTYQVPAGSLSAVVPRELQRLLLSNAAFSEEFFSTLLPVDNLPEVLGALAKIQAKEPALFTEYGTLAIAIAVVYDVPPPPQWPHGQVSAAVLPRKLPAPEQAFGYWARLDRGGVGAQRLRRLPASELKFLVDSPTPFGELDWARQQVGVGIADLAKAYDLIKYRHDRLAHNQYAWPGADYRLPTILTEGGICVDQAYFASMTGKAKGIPTIMFRGAGLDGRHAWFGFLDNSQRWQLDCGRYAEQKFVVGVAYDPQTWGNLNDHELRFITERFRALPTYKLSVLHLRFAREYLSDHQPVQALRAAREAVNRERRHFAAWQVLIEAQRAATPDDVRAKEAVLREAVLAFQKYPDIENSFSKQLGELLRSRGETSLAQHEAQQRGQKYQAARSDLSLDQAVETLARSMQQEDLANQIRTFNRILEASGRGAGMDYFDKVVAPFARHLAREKQIPAALQVLAKTRQTLRVEPGRQLDGELTALVARLKAGKVE